MPHPETRDGRADVSIHSERSFPSGNEYVDLPTAGRQQGWRSPPPPERDQLRLRAEPVRVPSVSHGRLREYVRAGTDRRREHDCVRQRGHREHSGWLARRWDDPAFPMAFPWFNTPRYWEEHILTLREQLQRLEEPPLSLY